MSTATPTTVTVTFDPRSTSKQADIIYAATPQQAGAMSAAQAAKLASLTPGMASTFTQTYDAGASSADQTANIAAGKGGPLLLKAASAATGSLLKALTSAAGVLLDITDNAKQSIRSFMTDGAAAIGLEVDTGSTWANATAKLQSWKNNAVEKAYLLANGDFFAGGAKLLQTGGFGFPLIGAQSPGGFMGYTADGVGAEWGGTGVVCRADGANSFVQTVVNDVVTSLTFAGVTEIWPGCDPATILPISGNTITPIDFLAFVGAGLIKTITPPTATEAFDVMIRIIPTAEFTWDATDNIFVGGTAVIGVTLDFTFDGTKWFPSYV